jgi:tetratricopeptide (TPR) repeat protein
MSFPALFGRSAIKTLCLISFGIVLALGIIEVGMRGAAAFLEHGVDRGSAGTGELRILCLGESTSAPYADEDWPKQLKQILSSKRPDLQVQVINEAYGGTNSTIILAALPQYLAEYHPQIVIAMVGINDYAWYGIQKRSPESQSLPRRLFERLKIVKLARYFYHEIYLPRRSFRWDQNVPPLRNAISRHDSIGRTIREQIARFIDTDVEYPTKGADPRQKDSALLEKIDAEAATAYMRLNADTRTSWAYSRLGDIRMRQHRLAEAQDAYQAAVKISPPYPPAYSGLAICYGRQNNFEEQSRALEYMIRSGFPVDLPPLLSNLLLDREPVGQREKAEHLLRELFDDQELRLDRFVSPGAATRNNYAGIRDLTRASGALFVAMQYPTLDIADLRQTLGMGGGTIFVSNEENFNRALSNGRYEDYFRDRFRGTWGHCTARGNALIAENLAKALLSEEIFSPNGRAR